MPASRWNSMSELAEWLSEKDWLQKEENLPFRELLFNQTLSEMFLLPIEQRENEESDSEMLEGKGPGAKLPTVLPILPLRGLVVYPQTAVPLTIGQPRSIRLVDDVVASEERLIGLLTSRDPELELPEPKDLYEVGTVAIVHRLFRAPD